MGVPFVNGARKRSTFIYSFKIAIATQIFLSNPSFPICFLTLSFLCMTFIIPMSLPTPRPYELCRMTQAFSAINLYLSTALAASFKF